jgi:hypothetical protein
MMSDVSAGTLFGYKPPLLVSWNSLRMTGRTYSFGNVDSGEGISDATRVAGANQSRNFIAVAQEYECGPQLDFVGASKPTSARISNLDMSYARMSGECGRQKRLGRETVSAYWTSEFEQRWSGKQIDLGAFRFANCILFVDRHVNASLLTKNYTEHLC